MKTVQFLKEKQEKYADTESYIELPLEDEIYKSLQKFVSQNKIDLLVLKSKKYNLIDRIFHKSLTKKLALHSSIPMIVIKD
ncbi:universal stress protein [Marinoscillum sp.]|uniref:universal stress protein n=1 Tax=Marinoscillum sp. TaxID=2024838 RepID=UPI003BAAD7CC